MEYIRVTKENLEKEHIGGCVLFEQEQEVKKLLGGA